MNRLHIHCRSLARRLGLTRIVSRFLELATPHGRAQEHEVAAAMATAIGSGDVVWDIGANLGRYTRLALDLVGDDGRVVAFEPVPECFELLSRTFAGEDRVQLVNSALGASAGTAGMLMESDRLASTHRIAAPRPPGHDAEPGMQQVEMVSGDHFAAAANRVPTVLKIDVEGHEAQVLAGMRHTLGEAQLLHVFVEVHFALLEAAGDAMAPLRIEQTLNAHGFRTRWLDRSHLHAFRAAATESEDE